MLTITHSFCINNVICGMTGKSKNFFTSKSNGVSRSSWRHFLRQFRIRNRDEVSVPLPEPQLNPTLKTLKGTSSVTRKLY